MPTERPRITITLSEDMMERIDEYKFGKRVKNQTKAVQELINRGLAVYDASITKSTESIRADELPFDPDYETAAVKAMEVLIKHRVTTMPISPLQILSSMPGLLLINFTEFADQSGFDRSNLAAMFGSDSQDVVTFIYEIDGKKFYLVAQNIRMPAYIIQFALARELGHIVLGHDNSQTNATQTAEALYFARHLICPRPLIQSLIEKDIPLTVELIGNLTGCYGRSLAGIRQTPGAHVPPKLNARLKEQFADYVNTVIRRISLRKIDDDSPLADFGTYMDNYMEG